MQGGAQILQPAFAQHANGLQALLGSGAVALWMQQPVTKSAAAHAALAGVEQAEQRGTGLAAQGLRQFEIALGGQRQVDQAVIALHLQAVQMCHCAPLGVLGVGQQRSGGGMGLRYIVGLPGVEVGAVQVFGEFALTQATVKREAGTFRDDETL